MSYTGLIWNTDIHKDFLGNHEFLHNQHYAMSLLEVPVRKIWVMITSHLEQYYILNM